MNPARSLAPIWCVVSSRRPGLAGPLLGAIIAVGFEWILKGPATPEGTRTAQGGPDER